ncbi:MAG: UDP-glucose/GDP-mannose dehydrogenase family protein, partial [Candidatus Marinimicrobia bacterium]|nr:UDP-glucose/GDP-mannose dehydrogenase family protein [Candidatus Neomarinimicrobiota bacterium]
ISFINEIAAVCETTGADVDQVRIGIGADNRIGRRFLFPGIGYGGSCFPKDVQSLIRSAAKMDIDLQILKAVENVNRDQKNLMVRKIKDYYQRDDLKGLTFAFWGLAFKPETDDVRESPSAVIIKGLLSAGAAIQAYDPAAIETFKQMYELPIKYNADMYACLEGADALVLATEWHHFRRPDFARIQNELRSPVIFDGRNQYDPDYVAGRGFNYISIGRRSVREANETAAR